MKISRIILPVLLTFTGFICLFSWLTIPQQAAQARIKIVMPAGNLNLKHGRVCFRVDNTSVNSIPITEFSWLSFAR